MEIQAMGQLLSGVANCQIYGRTNGKTKALVKAKVKSKGDDRINFQSSDDFSKAA